MRALTNSQDPRRGHYIVSVDETARGTLLGEVCAAAVIMPFGNCDDEMMGLINDSKKLTNKRRTALSEYIKAKAVAFGIGVATVEEIDRHNILQATYMAMHRALDAVYAQIPFRTIEVDGNRFKQYCPPDGAVHIEHECVIGGDAIRLGIAAASILAKVHRDGMIERLCVHHPYLDERYGILANMGYGTKRHMDGLAKYGASEFHRQSFAPVAKAAQKHQTSHGSLHAKHFSREL